MRSAANWESAAHARGRCRTGIAIGLEGGAILDGEHAWPTAELVAMACAPFLRPDLY